LEASLDYIARFHLKKKNLGVAVNVYNLSYLGGGDWI
jgi:hypothetical protein